MKSVIIRYRLPRLWRGGKEGKMRSTALQSMAVTAICFFLVSCASLRLSENRESVDYNTSSALKPGISSVEIQDLLNGPNDIYAGGFESGLTSSIWFFDQKTLPSRPLEFPANIVFTFDDEDAMRHFGLGKAKIKK